MTVGLFLLMAGAAQAQDEHLRTRVDASNVQAMQGKHLEDANSGGGDNTALLQTIGEAGALLADSMGHPAGAVVMLEDALCVAHNMAQQDLSQQAFDNCRSDLQEVMVLYKAAKGKTFTAPTSQGGDEGEAIDRGFRHPGGLHTQADFDRIHQQLANNNPTVVEAYNKLKSAAYAQSGVQTYPVETIIRGGSSGQNYINAARGATMAYQNALRWKIEGTKAHADAAVRILMAWARTCKLVSGDSNWALAAGLYGYEFAQAAELVRDYEGWAKDDFEAFKQWMLTVWYPGNINFLRGRNGTWENYVGNQGGIRPGHYWSNWPLCNVLAVISIGILCDDVFIYNQGMSFMKYDQVGTFQDPRTANPILNDGCTEFIGNLVVTTSESALETGAYGRLGQMQESGRDGGHAAMALGLAVDICHVAWNQGDDLFSYMDNRMAAGIEFVAACTQNVQGLPWSNYKYVDCRTAWHNGWLMEGPAEPAEVRNYWGTVIGHYEGVKGVKMPFSEKACEQMGIDVGGTGSTSGAYDHLGYSILMNTRDVQLCPEEQRPTLLTPRMVVDGSVIDKSELGGLRNTYVVQSTQPVAVGKSITLMPQLPEGEEDTGLWQWNTGQTTKDITITADRSFVYRATYTNARGVQSDQMFSIAVEGDCTPSLTHGSIYANGELVGDTVATVFYGDKISLTANDTFGWNTAIRWDNGQTGAQANYGRIGTERTIQAYIVSQGERKEPINFHLRLKYLQPCIVYNGTLYQDTTRMVVSAGDDVTLQPYVPTAVGPVSYDWDNGSTSPSLPLGPVETSGVYTVTISWAGHAETITYEVFVKDSDTSRLLTEGNYLVRHVATDSYMTCNGLQQYVTFTEGNPEAPKDGQVWYFSSTNQRYSMQALPDSLGLASSGRCISTGLRIFYWEGALGLERYALRTGTGTSSKYWNVADAMLVSATSSKVYDFPFELIPYNIPTGISDIEDDTHSTSPIVYDLQGRRMANGGSPYGRLNKGVYIFRSPQNRNGRKVVVAQ